MFNSPSPTSPFGGEAMVAEVLKVIGYKNELIDFTLLKTPLLGGVGGGLGFLYFRQGPRFAVFGNDVLIGFFGIGEFAFGFVPY